MTEELDIDEQPRKHISLLTTEEKETKTTLCRNLLGHLRLHVSGSLDEILDHLVTLLLAGGLDLLQLLLGFLVRVVLGLLEPARVLEISHVSRTLSTGICSTLQNKATLEHCISPRPRTSCILLPSACGTLRSPSEPLTWRPLSAWYGL